MFDNACTLPGRAEPWLTTFVRARRGTVLVKRLIPLFSVLGLLALVTSASAATVQYSGSVSQLRTSWTQYVSLHRFDTSLGTLKSVRFEVTGYVSGIAGFENQDAEGGAVTTTLSAVVKLFNPRDASLLVTTTPSASRSETVFGYDGTDDYGGSSGRTYTDLTGNLAQSTLLTSSTDLNWFKGTNDYSVMLTAKGASSGSGPGDLLLKFSTNSKADVKVTYEYDAIPEPASLLGLFTGLGGLLGMVKLRRK